MVLGPLTCWVEIAENLQWRVVFWFATCTMCALSYHLHWQRVSNMLGPPLDRKRKPMALQPAQRSFAGALPLLDAVLVPNLGAGFACELRVLGADAVALCDGMVGSP